jgi:hypothetical protein
MAGFLRLVRKINLTMKIMNSAGGDVGDVGE